MARLALICNILFLFCLVMQRVHDLMPQGSVKSTIIVLGWFVAPFVNLVVNLWVVSARILGKAVPVPGWLTVSNLLILVLQFFVYFIFAS